MDRSDHEKLKSADALYSVFLGRRKQAEEDAGELVKRFVFRFSTGIQSTHEMFHPIEYLRYTESRDSLFRELKVSLVHCFTKVYTGLSKEYIVLYNRISQISGAISFQTQWKDILAMTEFYMGRFVRFVKDSLDGLATDAMIQEKKNSDLVAAMVQKQKLFLARINIACHMLALYFCNSLATHINTVGKNDGELVDVESRKVFSKSNNKYRLPDNKKHSFVWKKYKGERIGTIPPSRFKGKEIIIPSATKNIDSVGYS